MFRSFGWSRVSILTTDTAYGKDQANEFRRLWLGKHTDSSGTWEGEVPHSHTILLNPNGTVNEASVNQALGGMPKDAPRVILLIAHDHHAYPILKTATESNFQPDTIWIGTEAWVDRFPTGDLSWLPEVPGYIGLSPFRNRDDVYLDYLHRLQAWQVKRGKSKWDKLPDYAAEYLVGKLFWSLFACPSLLSIVLICFNPPSFGRQIPF